MTNKPLLTQKDIARMTGFSVRTVRRRAALWRLDQCRVDTGTQTVRYRSLKTISLLRQRGFVD